MNKRGMRGLVALVCAAGVLPVLTTTGAASAAPARCFGKVATIVSHADEVTGTKGDDVIVVTARLASVEGRAGDDLICIRGRRGTVVVDPGSGDDRVRVETRTTTLAELRTGSDTFLGGPGNDVVLTGVRSGRRNDDRVSLGGGDDQLLIGGGGDNRSARLRGGAGDDTIALYVSSGPLAVDAAAGSATFRGRGYATWDGFESHAALGPGRVSFRGTEGADEAMLVGSSVEAAMLAGDDTVVVLAESPDDAFDARADLRRAMPRTVAARLGRSLARRATVGARPAGVHARSATSFALDPGEGTDVLEVETTAPLLVGDLATDQVVATDVQGTVVGTVPAAGFEGLTARAFLGMSSPGQRFELTGDDADNRLQANTCEVLLRGGAGNDHLRVGDDGEAGLLSILTFLQDGCARSSEAHGDAGDDTLVSRVLGPDFRAVMKGDMTAMKEVRVRDLLDGGEGTDSADAGKGMDTCLAEVRTGCEY